MNSAMLVLICIAASSIELMKTDLRFKPYARTVDLNKGGAECLCRPMMN